VSGQIWLVRHGESEWNRSGQYAGQQDIPLDDRGREQVRRLAERLSDERIRAIYSSPLQRALDTARAIASLSGAPIFLEPGLKEIHHGSWEGLTSAQANAGYPVEYAAWHVAPHTAVMPEGETLLQVQARAGEVMRRVRDELDGGKSVICSHDAVLRVIVLQALGIGLEHFWKWDFDNASSTVLEACDEEGRPPFRLVRMNDVTHLAGILSPIAVQAL
jgi:broad specificity phosphatase PhoE